MKPMTIRELTKELSRESDKKQPIWLQVQVAGLMICLPLEAVVWDCDGDGNKRITLEAECHCGEET